MHRRQVLEHRDLDERVLEQHARVPHPLGLGLQEEAREIEAGLLGFLLEAHRERHVGRAETHAEDVVDLGPAGGMLQDRGQGPVLAGVGRALARMLLDE